MNILSIGNFSNPSWDGSQPDEEHIAKALEELGHEVERVQREELKSLVEQYRGVESKEWRKFDFILTAQWDGYSSYVKELKKQHNTKLVYWAFDYQNEGQEWHENLVKEADLYLSKRIADSKHPNWQWLSQDFAPGFLDKPPHINIERDIDLLFTGSYLDWATERNETLKAIDDKFNLVIHSVNDWPGFKTVLPPIMDNGLPELYARAKVVLSIDHTLEAGYWSDRNAQAMCCGAFVLCRYVPLMEARFSNKVQYFYSIDNCLKQIDAIFGSDEELLDVLRNDAYEYAQANLKVYNRVKDLLTIMDNIL